MGTPPANAAVRDRLWPAFALIVAMLTSNATSAQTGPSLLFSNTPTTGLISPAPVTRGEVFGPGGGASQWPTPSHPAAPQPAAPMVPAGQVALALSARFGSDAPQIDGGL